MRYSTVRQRGFTLIEILVVILIIGILAAYFGQNIFGQTQDAKLSIAEVELTDTIPTALMSMSTAGSIGKDGDGYYDVRPALIKRGVKPETPWGEPWEATADNNHNSATTPDDNTIMFTYPIGGKDAAANADVIRSKLRNTASNPMIFRVGGSGATITFRYRVAGAPPK